jgi:predicted phosphodiesterase
MLSDFEMISHKFPERPDLTIVPISDVHIGAAEQMWKEWESFCKRVLSNPNIYITLGGDLINNGTRSSVSNLFEETMRPRDQKRLMVEMLTPIRDRILCAVSGNHERRSGKDADDDPTYDILCKLDIENLYRENIAFVKIQMGEQKSNGKHNPTYMLVVTHGAGGGALTGGAVNRNERFGYAIDGADVLIVGHTHKPFITQPAKIFIDKFNNQVSVKPFKVVSSTSWLQYGGYAAQKMLSPTSHAPQTITLCGTKKEIIATM